MVAYSFQKRFAHQVGTGQKTQTIRANRKRHARPGEPMQLYTAMRTKYCRKLIDPDPICSFVLPIEILVPERDVEPLVLRVGAQTKFKPITISFAQADGFKSEYDFRRFWAKHHGFGLFEGVLIGWAKQ